VEGMIVIAEKTILLADDSGFMRKILKNILTRSGYSVVGEAENGIKAIEMYNMLKPNLVILDITMSEMNGIEAAKGILKSDESASIIMCSAMGQQSFVVDSIKAGAKDFIVKPFQPARVLETVAKVIGY